MALVTWVTSTRADLALLVDHGRRMGTVIGVDITRGAGLLPFARTGAEVVATLRRRGVTADHRGRALRLSPGVVTTAEGCDLLADALPEAAGRH